MNVVIYARFSSHSQTEQSIEGQLKVCHEYAEANGHIVIDEYIDRAQSGTTDSRAEFQRMIADSDKHTFEAVLVYQLDRFARNRYDSAINKAKLKKNGVRVISAKENITDDASGILVEGILESMAEYYSVELSQKIRRGMAINAEKCLSTGSNPGLGFKVDAERRFYIDEEAAIVREIFERYAKGDTVADIVRDLNARQIKTSRGKEFNKNSLHRLLRNKRYIGTYIYKDQETPNGMPRIISDELFERVQRILDKNKAAPARSRGKEEYLLTTKLFCGYCKEAMVGYSGKSKSGAKYCYYACKNAKKKLCRKKTVSKDYIEDKVIATCRTLLTDKNIETISKEVAKACQADANSASIKRINAAIREADTAIENLWKALEQGNSVDKIMERIQKREKEKEELEAQLAIEMGRLVILTEPQVKSFLTHLRTGDINSLSNRRGLINIFVRSIYLYDDRFTLILNGSGQPIEIDDLLLDEIEGAFSDDANNKAGCSPLVEDAPPFLRAFAGLRTLFSFSRGKSAPGRNPMKSNNDTGRKKLMIIAVTYENGQVFQHFGHTETFKIYEVEDGRIVGTEMLGSNGSGHGALAGLLDDRSIDVLICGGIGGGAQTALAERGIELCAGASGDADEAVAAYLRGELINTGANCDHHGEGHSCDDHGEGCGHGGCHGEPDIQGKNVGKTCRTHYRGTFNDGTQFDSSYDRGEPLEFVCGAGMMIKGFDEAVANMDAGQVVDVHLMPSEAYGEHDPAAVFTVEISRLPGAEELSAGQQVYLQNSYGQPVPVKVTARDEKTITFDANHEMAGKELNFRIELVEVID